jgi:peptide deformylase
VLTLPEGKDRRLDAGDEGCLSFPGAFIECARPDFATVRGTGLDGEPVEFSGDGLLARCLQHETDHTLGTVFGDRLSAKARKKLQKEHDRLADEFPPEWPAETA